MADWPSPECDTWAGIKLLFLCSFCIFLAFSSFQCYNYYYFYLLIQQICNLFIIYGHKLQMAYWNNDFILYQRINALDKTICLNVLLWQFLLLNVFACIIFFNSGRTTFLMHVLFVSVTIKLSKLVFIFLYCHDVDMNMLVVWKFLILCEQMFLLVPYGWSGRGH